MRGGARAAVPPEAGAVATLRALSAPSAVPVGIRTAVGIRTPIAGGLRVGTVGNARRRGAVEVRCLPRDGAPAVRPRRGPRPGERRGARPPRPRSRGAQSRRPWTTQCRRRGGPCRYSLARRRCTKTRGRRARVPRRCCSAGQARPPRVYHGRDRRAARRSRRSPHAPRPPRRACRCSRAGARPRCGCPCPRLPRPRCPCRLSRPRRRPSRPLPTRRSRGAPRRSSSGNVSCAWSSTPARSTTVRCSCEGATAKARVRVHLTPSMRPSKPP
ncbi:hypothetical protein M885DRAFT_510479 [Pelagophyceae sp. CCMP2097]|nr:hypothetical protein M885DRAFT_510479 [Pelagophyceae sp. CCMP2097]